MMRIGFLEKCWNCCTVTRKGIATARIDQEENEPAGRLRPVWRFREKARRSSNFENDRENERAFGCLFVDVALEVYANFFLDDGPVGAFFGVGRIDRSQYDIARAGHQVAAVVAHKSARHDFRL